MRLSDAELMAEMYTLTLAGHETIDEDVDKAVLAFQTALRADPRHYNAWCVSLLTAAVALFLLPFPLLRRKREHVDIEAGGRRR